MDYHCESCGYRTAKWMGFCPQCRRQGSLRQPPPVSANGGAKPLGKAAAEPKRRETGIAEIDRVLGGGLVPGAAILVGGEPGIGKSTLLLQAAEALARRGATTLVATAEESADQVALRAARLGVADPAVFLVAERNVGAILHAAGELRPELLIVDSVQAIEDGGVPGSVSQVRECATRLIQFAKSEGVAVILVGHVTKDGGIAGPKLLEHAVDVVLYLEGEQELGLRLLRSLKNRFGATHQVGLFEMGSGGLAELPDPSRALVGQWRGEVPGTVVFPSVDGRRPMLVEVQALVAPTSTPQPRRSVRGLDGARVHQLLAVLERHAGLPFTGHDVYVSAVGGVRIREPAADLAVALAIGSSLLNRALGPVAAWGEVGLTGEVRGVPHDGHRREEAARLGIESFVSANGDGRSRIEACMLAAGLGVVAVPERADDALHRTRVGVNSESPM